jgi:membrane protease YdiL (CAAX protease family)
MAAGPLLLRGSWTRFPLVSLVAGIGFYLVARLLSVWLAALVAIRPPAGSVIRAAIAVVVTLAVYKLFIARLGEPAHDDLPTDSLFVGLGQGIAAGSLLFASVVAIAAMLGIYRVTGLGDAPQLLVPLVTAAVAPAFMEELLFRGILLRWIEEFAGSWIALVVTSALFGLAHILNPGATWFSSFAVAVEAGLMLGGAYMLTRSLWMPIGLHAAWNFTQGPLFGVPVSGLPASGLVRATLSGPELLSGGSFGLEASVISIAVCSAAGSWFLWRVARRDGLARPWWVR